MLSLAANSGDTQDNAANAEEHARRTVMTGEAAEGFAAQDAVAAGDMTGVVEQDPSTAASAQQLPQLLAGIAAAVSGAFTGVMQPFAAIPQQIAHGAQQAFQAAAGLTQPTGGIGGDGIDDPSLYDLGADFESDADDPDQLGGLSDAAAAFPDGSGLSGGGPAPVPTGGGGAPPGVLLAPAAVPSAATAPASATGLPSPAPAAHIPTAGGGAGMAGVPMVPPGGPGGAGGADRDPKADTKRIATPPIRNGAAVQGRIAVAPAVIASTEAKPVTSRQMLTPADGRYGSASSDRAAKH